MGLLTDLINERHEKKRAEQQNKIAGLKALLTSPDAQPAQREWALQQMLGETGTPKGGHGPLLRIFQTMLGIGRGPAEPPGEAPPPQAPTPPTDAGVTEGTTGGIPESGGLPQAGPSAGGPPPPPGAPPRGGPPGRPGQRPSGPTFLTPEELRQQAVADQQALDEQTLNLERQRIPIDIQRTSQTEAARQAQVRADDIIRANRARLLIESGVPADQGYAEAGVAYRPPAVGRMGVLAKGIPASAITEDDPIPGKQPGFTGTYQLLHDERGLRYIPEAPKQEKLPADLNSWYQSIRVQWEQQKGSPLTEDENRQALAAAGRLNTRARAGAIEAREMTAAINEELSGIRRGVAIPSYPARGAAQPTTAPTAPSTAPPERAAPTAPTTPPARPGPISYTRPDGQKVTITPAEQELLDRFQYLAATSTSTTGRSGAVQVGFKKAQAILQKVTGLNPFQLAAAFAEKRGTLTAIVDNVKRLNSLERISTTLDKQGEVLMRAARLVDDTGSPVLNSLVRGVESNVQGAPTVASFRLALNAVARDYAAAQSSGGISNATIPVHSQQESETIFGQRATEGQLEADLATIRQEVQASVSAQKENQANRMAELGAPIATPDSADPFANLPKPSRPGQRIPDNVIEQYKRAAGGNAQRALEAAQKAGWQ